MRIKSCLTIKFNSPPPPKKRVCRYKKTFCYFVYLGFPGIVGAVDCTHVQILRPHEDNYWNYRNRKGGYSINVQVFAIDGSYRPKVHDWASRALEIVKIKSCLSGLNFYSAVFVRSPAFCKHQLYCKIPTGSVFVHLLLKACFSGMT